MRQYAKRFVRATTSDRYYVQIRNQYRKWFAWYEAHRYLPVLWPFLKLIYAGSSHYCPVCDSQLRKFLPFYGKPRRCPVCSALDRHRLMWLYFDQKTDLFSYPKKRMLHAAPERCFVRHFQNSDVVEYVSIDLVPYAMIQTSLTQLCLPDESFDVVYASHVLEHIPEDRQAIAEIYRVLKAGGWAILQVPSRPGPTYEDPSIVDPDERERAFGQYDHVRIYGEDYVDRLQEAGFAVVQDSFVSQLDRTTVERLSLNLSEAITFCCKE